jgi:hypothetical protein
MSDVIASDLSEIITDQRNEQSCGYHAAAKVVVQNVFQFFIPRKIVASTYKGGNCNQFVDFDIYDKGISDLSIELCSLGGYERILQFLYVYHLIYDRVSKKGEPLKPTGSRMVYDILSDIWAENIPQYFDDKKEHRDYLVEMVKRVNKQKIVHDLKYIHLLIEFPKTFLELSSVDKARCKLVFDMIKTVNNKGLFMYVVLKGRNRVIVNGVNHTLHAVHLVATYKNEIVIKNSWGDERVYSMQLAGSVLLNGQKEYFIERIAFVLPVSNMLHEKPEQSIHLDGAHFESTLARWNPIFMYSMPLQRSVKELSYSPVFRRGEVIEAMGQLGVFLTYGPSFVLAEFLNGKLPVELKHVKRPLHNGKLWQKVRDMRLIQIAARLVASDDSAYKTKKHEIAPGAEINELIENELQVLENHLLESRESLTYLSQFALPTPAKETLKAKSPRSPKKDTKKSPLKKPEIVIIDSDEDVVMAPRGVSPTPPTVNGYLDKGIFKSLRASVSSSAISGFKDAKNYFFETLDVL